MACFNKDTEVLLIGTLPSGEVYSATVALSREIASAMERITMHDPYKYNRYSWLNLYYDALDLLGAS